MIPATIAFSVLLKSAAIYYVIQRLRSSWHNGWLLIGTALFLMSIQAVTRLYNTWIQQGSGAVAPELLTLGFSLLILLGVRQLVHEVQENQDKTENLISTLPQGVMAVDRSGTITFANPAMNKLLGTAQGTVAGATITEFWECEIHRNIIAEEQEEPGLQAMDIKCRLRDGDLADHHLNWDYKRGKDGAITGYIAIVNDVTTQKKQEEDLHRNQSRLARAQHIAGLGYWEANLLNDEWFWSRENYKIFGIDKDSKITRELFFSFVDPKELGPVQDAFEASLIRKSPFNFDCKIIRPDGERRFIHIQGRVECDTDGAAFTMSGTIQDLTERHRAVQARSRIERRLRSVLAALPDLVVVLNEEGRYLEVLSENHELLAESAETLPGKLLSDLMPPDVAKVCLDSIARTLSSGEAQQVVYSLDVPKGHCWFEARTIPLKQRNDNKGSVIWVARDITTTHLAQDEIRKLSRAVEQSPVLVVITDLDGKIQFVNSAFTAVTGYTPEDVIGKNPRMLKGIPPSKDVYKQLWETVTNGRIWRGEFNNRKKNGELYWESATIGPVKDMDGNTTHYLAIKEDITEKKALEKDHKMLQKQLVQAQKLETLGTLAGGIAHDFNNILSPILGYTEMAREKVEESSRVYAYLGYILSSAHRARELVEQILTFSRAEEHPQHPVALHIIAKEVIQLLRAWIPGNIEIRANISKQTGTVNCNPTQINQVLMNLCTNAAHAMNGRGGILEIGLEKLEDAAPITTTGTLPRGPWVCLTVKDTGSGMDKTIKERIFEPFFTTKSVDEGTGLGLSVVHGIIKSHGAAIMVESEPGEGTSFYVYFPPSNRAEREQVLEEPIFKGRGRILFVDDEEPIANMVKEMLSDLGYTVSIQLRAQHALELFKEKPDAFDLVISDHNMPGLTGCQLAEEIHKERADIPFILISGYNEVVKEEEIELGAITEYLRKPVGIKTLCKAIEKSLDLSPSDSSSQSDS